jgi:hypothetical protein
MPLTLITAAICGALVTLRSAATLGTFAAAALLALFHRGLGVLAFTAGLAIFHLALIVTFTFAAGGRILRIGSIVMAASLVIHRRHIVMATRFG